MRMKKISLKFLAFAMSVICCVTEIQAQTTWPNRPVTIVSPYNPGGTNDVPARILADEFQKIFGQPFIVKNVPGAAGIIGTQQVMNSPADGYTLLLSNSGAMLVQPVIKTPRPYDPLINFTPIATIAEAYAFIGVSGELPVKNVSDLIALAKKQPGQLNYSSAGIGSAGHFIGEHFKTLTSTDILHVPGKGSAAAVMEMKAGRIQLMFDPLVVPQASDGRIKVLAVLSKSRLSHLPEIPTVKEAGGPEMDRPGWFGLFGPANLPQNVLSQLENAFDKVVADPEVRKKLQQASLIPAVQKGPAFRANLKENLTLHEEIKRRSNLVFD